MTQDGVSASLADEQCGISYCSACLIREPVKRVFIRGLCPESIFDSQYHYSLGQDGSVVFMGVHTSTIFYNRAHKLWNWVDRKDNATLATSATPEARMLLGVNKFNMSTDRCADGGRDTTMRIKVTTCEAGMFTCDDGQCIDVEERCL